MENGRAEEGFVREWSPCTTLLSLLPPRVQAGLFSTELRLSCLDAVTDYIALGTNVGLVYWYNRKNGTIERLRCEANQSGITYVKIVNTVDYMVAAGNTNGQVTVFQIPKELPDSVPDTLKPKNEPRVERYTVGDLHRSKITSIEWSKNGMRLFSGDKNGVIIMTEIDFYMHLCKSVEIVNEEYEIVQISYHHNSLLVSSLFRTILCEQREAKWHISQVGKKDRKSLCPLGAVFQWSYAQGGAGEVVAYCARPGLRLWRADKAGEVHQTLLFKDAVSNPTTIAELLNPSHTKHPTNTTDCQFGTLHVFRENFIVTHDSNLLYILDPNTLTAVAVLDDLRRIMCVSVNKDEIFILEGERSVIRLGHVPEADGVNSGKDPLNAMTKSLTTSIQQVVNTVRELAHADAITPFIASIIDQPTSKWDAHENAEECFELPPVKALPPDVAINVLESMIETFKEDEVRKTNIEDLQKKMKLYNMIAEPRRGEELLFSSKRSRKPLSEKNTPKGTPVRTVAHVSSDVKRENGVDTLPTNFNNIGPEENDEEISKQIEEKEKMLAKMLDLESLSISPRPIPDPISLESQIGHFTRDFPLSTSNKIDIVTRSYPVTLSRKINVSEPPMIKPFEVSLPKMAEIPQNWNLGSLQVVLETNGQGEGHSPDNIESEWEFV